jgi:hypothetical protein
VLDQHRQAPGQRRGGRRQLLIAAVLLERDGLGQRLAGDRIQLEQLVIDAD